MNFLSPDIRKKTINLLLATGCPLDIAEKATNIPEEEADKHRFAHASMCHDNAMYQENRDEGSDTKLICSIIVLLAINEEACKRGMDSDDFPMSQAFMSGVVEANGGESVTRH